MQRFSFSWSSERVVQILALVDEAFEKTAELSISDGEINVLRYRYRQLTSIVLIEKLRPLWITEDFVSRWYRSPGYKGLHRSLPWSQSDLLPDFGLIVDRWLSLTRKAKLKEILHRACLAAYLTQQLSKHFEGGDVETIYGSSQTHLSPSYCGEVCRIRREYLW